ncbi:small membrane protein YoaI [Enterobacter sp. UNJFSC 003]|nr:small membrane protein YoaI [Serratia liquefaciens]
MNDHMFVETLIISTSFFTIAIILVASVLILERKG